MPALGEEFRSAREARGLSLSEVSEQIHIRSVYLNAIENDDWPSIGAPVYVRGFLRTYARFLGLDAEGAVERFNRTIPPERHAPAAAAVTSVGGVEDERAGVSPWAIVSVLVAAILVGFVGFEWWTYAHGTSENAVATAPQATAAATAPAGPVQPGSVAGGSGTAAPDAASSASPPPSPLASAAASLHHQLAIRLTERSWLRVTVDGKTQLEGIYPFGTARTVHGSVADVRAGNAGGVQVVVDGRPAPPLGASGDVDEHRYKL